MASASDTTMSTAPDKAEGGGGGSGGGGTEKKDFLFVIVNDESKSKNERIREVLAHARRAYLNSEEHRNLQAKRQKEKTTRQLQWRSGTAEEKQVPGRERKKRAAGSGSEKQTTPPRWDERTRTAASAQAVVVHGREQGRRSAWRDETGSTTMYPELTTYTINGAPAGWSIAALANVCNHIEEIVIPLYGTRFHPQGPNVLQDHWLTGAKAHPVMFHSLVYVCTHAARQDTESTNFLFHRGRALSHIRDVLSVKSVSITTADEVLATITLLGMADFLLGEFSNMANHMSGMHLLVTNRGGVNAIGFQGHLRKVFIEYMMLSCLLNDTDLPREYREASPKLPIPRDLEIFTWESSTTPDTTPSPGADSSSADNNYGSSESTVSASTLSTPSPPANPVVFVPQNAAAVTSTPPCTSVSGAQPQKQEYLHPFHFQQQQQMKHQQDQSQQYQYQHQEQRQYTPPLTTSAPNTFPSPSPPPFLAPPSNGATGQQAFLDPTQYMSPELHSLLLPVSTTAARWDAFFPLIDSSVPTPAHIATQLKLLVGRDAETLYRRYKAAPPPITYKAQAIRLAGLLFAMAPGKGLASAQPRSPPAVASAMLSAPSPLSRTHRGVPVPDDWDDDDVDTSGATERIDVTLPHRPHYGSQQCSSSSPPPQVQGRAHADVAYGSCAHPFQQTQEAAQRAAFSRAAARRALVMGREALVQLRQCLEVAYTQYPWEDVPGALMWCLVVGTYATARVIAATDNNGRGGYDVNDNDSSDLSDAERRELRDCGFYFRRELKRALLSIGLSKWDEMVACLRVWIWLIRCRWKGTIVPR